MAAVRGAQGPVCVWGAGGLGALRTDTGQAWEERPPNLCLLPLVFENPDEAVCHRSEKRGWRKW